MMIPLILVIISLFAFFLSKMVKQDPAINLLQQSGLDQEVIDYNSQTYINAYNSLNLNRPTFYFSILPQNHPSNINEISSNDTKKLIRSLLGLGYDIEEILPQFANNSLSNDALKKQIKSSNTQELESLFGTRLKFVYPTVRWHGSNNQYHAWLSNLIKGDFGNSTLTGKKVWPTVKSAMQFTLFMSIIAIIFTFTLGIAIGYFLAKNPEGRKQKILNELLFFLYSIPIFWLATLLVIFFTTDDFGDWTNIFPSIGINIIPEASTMGLIFQNLEKFILPILCIFTYVIVYIARMLRRGILDQMSMPYIRTAFSKGLSKNQIMKRHAIPNAMLPIITIFVGALSRAISGSVVIEIIFNIPGMGRLLFNSISVADWNIVFCIILLTGLITVIAYLIGDLLYALLDPRIRYASAH